MKFRKASSRKVKALLLLALTVCVMTGSIVAYAMMSASDGQCAASSLADDRPTVVWSATAKLTKPSSYVTLLSVPATVSAALRLRAGDARVVRRVTISSRSSTRAALRSARGQRPARIYQALPGGGSYALKEPLRSLVHYATRSHHREGAAHWRLQKLLANVFDIHRTGALDTVQHTPSGKSRLLLKEDSALNVSDLIDLAAEAGFARTFKTETSVTFSRVLHLSQTVPQEKKIVGEEALYFDMPTNMAVDDITSVTLLLRIRYFEEKSQLVKVAVGSLVPRGKKSKPRRMLHSLQALRVTYGNMAIDIDVTRLAKQWIAEPKTNYGLNVNLTWLSEGNSSVHQLRLPNDSIPTRATLEFRAQSGGRQRSESKPSNGTCGDVQTYSFDDFGSIFDFVVSPRSYTAHRCGGTCSPASARNVSTTPQYLCKDGDIAPIDVVYTPDEGRTYVRGPVRINYPTSCKCVDAGKKTPVLSGRGGE